MDFNRNKKYFAEPNTMWGVILLVAGLLGLIGFTSRDGTACGVVGLLVAAVGGFILFGSTAGRPSDSEIDEICRQQISNIKQKALNKLGIDEEEVKLIEPVIIQGYHFSSISSPVLVKTGKDNVNRASNYDGMILFFGENQVHSYKYTFSIVADEHLENADEYFYKDIVTISTASEKEIIKYGKGNLKEKTINFEAFKLTTTGGNSLVCAVRDLGGVEKSIQGMRQLLRQKKLEKVA